MFDWPIEVWVAVVLGVAILGAAGFLLWRVLYRREALLHHVRCPDCGQKVRYVPERAGREAVCPRCRRQFQLPLKPQPLAKSGSRLVPGTRKGEKEDRS